jgi:hypothetical protein
VRGIVVAADATSSTTTAVWMWSPSHVWRHVEQTFTAEEIAAPGGGAIVGARGIVVSDHPTVSTTAQVWIWTAEAVLRENVGTATTTEIEGPGGIALAGVRGVAVSVDHTNSTTRRVWLWTADAVYRVLPGIDTAAAEAITAPGGGAIAGTWSILATPENFVPSGSEVWIRTATGVLRHDGNPPSLTTTTAVTRPGDLAIGSPVVPAGQRALALVKNQHTPGAGADRSTSPYLALAIGEEIDSAVHVPRTPGTPAGELTTVVAHGGAGLADGGDSAVQDLESAVLLVSPELFSEGFERGDAGGWSAAGG